MEARTAYYAMAAALTAEKWTCKAGRVGMMC
jgi:hypothetical protein